MQIFRGYELSQIHNASMEILRDTGVKFNSSRALKLFEKHGFKTIECYLDQRGGQVGHSTNITALYQKL